MTKIFLLGALFPLMAIANSDLAIAQAELIKKLEAREAKLELNALRLQNLRVNAITPKPTIIAFSEFKGPPLQCIKSAFPWFFNDYSMEYLDCTFKLNIGDPENVQRLFATLKAMKQEGWEVSKSEVYKQNIINEKQIMNEERYRFIRNKNNK